LFASKKRIAAACARRIESQCSDALTEDAPYLCRLPDSFERKGAKVFVFEHVPCQNACAVRNGERVGSSDGLDARGEIWNTAGHDRLLDGTGSYDVRDKRQTGCKSDPYTQVDRLIEFQAGNRVDDIQPRAYGSLRCVL